MKKNSFYKHKYCTDVCIRVEYISKYSGDFKVKVDWFNINNITNPFYIASEIMSIKVKDYPDWKEVFICI